MTTYRLWWISSDQQAEIDCGSYDTYPTPDEIEKQKAVLLDQCGAGASGEQERARIKAGYFVIDDPRKVKP